MCGMNNQNSIIFAGAVLAAVLLGNITRESPSEITFEPKIENTSLVADVKTVSYSDTIFLPSQLTAHSALVKDMAAQEPVWTLNPDQAWPTASLAKLVTAVVAKEKIDPGQKIKVSAEAVATEGEAGSLKADGVYLLEDLLKTLLILSSNDAATALMEFYGETKFIQAMNLKAQAMRMSETRFFDPSGLSAINQSNVKDLEKLIDYIIKYHPDILAITKEKKEGSTHPFVGKANFLGGKTGFIDEANGNLISLFNNGGRTLLIIVLGSEDRAKDTQILYDYFTSH